MIATASLWYSWAKVSAELPPDKEGSVTPLALAVSVVVDLSAYAAFVAGMTL